MDMSFNIFLDDREDFQCFLPRRRRVAGHNRVEQGAVKWKGARGEIGPVERLGPEALEAFAHLLEQLLEQRIVSGVVNRKVKGKVRLAGRTLSQMNALHLFQPKTHRFDIVLGAAASRRHRRLNLDPTAHFQRHQKRVSQALRLNGNRHMDGRGGNRLQEIIAAALAGIDNAKRLKLSDHLTNGGTPDTKS